MKIKKSPQVPEESTSRQPAGVAQRRWPVLVTLLIVLVGGGVLVTAHLFSPTSQTARLSLVAPPTSVPTSMPVPTPTSTTLEAGDVLETFYLDIAPGDFAKIEAKREEALSHWILVTSAADFVPATLRLDQEEIPVKVRLKGDWADHIAGDKWSFRVETRDDHYVHGMRVFSLQDPSTRTYLNEGLFLDNLRVEGVLSVHYRYVRVVLNGEYRGIYALEEGFTKELLESQQRREAPIIRYDEDLVWKYRVAYENDELVPRGVNEFHIIDEFDSGKIKRDPLLSAQRDTAVGLLRALWNQERPASQVFDLETLGKFLALVDLWDARHALVWHNQRFYYNPITALLEPVVFDAQPLPEAGDVELVSLAGLRQTVAYDDPSLQLSYLHFLRAFSQPEYLAELEERYGSQLQMVQTALEPEFGAELLKSPWERLALRQRSLRELLQPYQMVYVYQPNILTETLSLDVGNLLDFQVEIVAVQVGAQHIPVRPEWVASDAADLMVRPLSATPEHPVLRPLTLDATSMQYARLQVPREVLTFANGIEDPPKIELLTRIWGLPRTVAHPVVLDYPLPVAHGPLPERPTVEEALGQHPYLVEVEGAQMLHIPPGDWEITRSLVLPEGYGLQLDPGTTLRFGAENYLLASGPLRFEGTAEAPVTLQPTGERWRGIVVWGARETSIWRHVTVEKTLAINQDGWTLTGGITFYLSDLRLDQSRILQTESEDAINVVRGQIAFTDVEFAYAPSDAVDIDFGEGFVERCTFHDIAGDGFDVSGSVIELHDVRMYAIGDKGLSVGEASRVTAEGLCLEDLDFGVVSKDSSWVRVTDLTLQNIRRAGLAAYIKKPAYGPASITANGVTFVQVPEERRTLVQTGSWIDLEGERIWGAALDVSSLYER
ncbi:MAG: CotH kinase family protein [Anaerolineae bacterium]|nr:CotH kinase family protein [Anaerolineae bacterium]